jgi:hypothetical protein
MDYLPFIDNLNIDAAPAIHKTANPIQALKKPLFQRMLIRPFLLPTYSSGVLVLLTRNAIDLLT